MAKVVQSSMRPAGNCGSMQRQRVQRKPARRFRLRRPLLQVVEGQVAGRFGIERIGAESSQLQVERMLRVAFVPEHRGGRVVQSPRVGRSELECRPAPRPERAARRSAHRAARRRTRVVSICAAACSTRSTRRSARCEMRGRCSAITSSARARNSSGSARRAVAVLARAAWQRGGGAGAGAASGAGSGAGGAGAGARSDNRRGGRCGRHGAGAVETLGGGRDFQPAMRGRPSVSPRACARRRSSARRGPASSATGFGARGRAGARARRGRRGRR